ncbi:MAG: phosphate/phosphite/phosphonate ABC transporter substrate-binding protein [Betaproteobacteria bacterium]
MIVNARMYSATPQARQAWKALFREVLERAGLRWEIVDHDAPAPLSALWARADLGCAMMCGLPYSQRRPRPALVAAPLPSPARYGGQPRYFTDIAVRADAPYQRLEDTFGGVVGFTLPDSMSGYVALRRHLAAYGANPYKKAVSGLLNARQVIEALDERRIDVGPLDSYYYDLLQAGDPVFASKVRVIGSTAAAPIPPLVATAELDENTLERLRSALLAVGEREELLLKGFAVPAPSDYDQLQPWTGKDLP